MSSGSGSKTTGTQKTSSNLPKGVEGALGTTLQDAQSLYSGANGGGGFNAAAYLKANPDVAANSKWSQDPAGHYAQYGQKEGRSTGAPANPATAPQLFKPYTESTVVPYSGETEQSWQTIQNAVSANAPGLNGSYQGISNIANGSGFNGTQEGAMAQLMAIMNGANGITTGGQYSNLYNSQGTTTAGAYADMASRDAITTGGQYQALYGNGTNTADAYGAIASGNGGINTGGLYSQIGTDANGSYSESNLRNYANGSQIGASNPAFERVLTRAQTDAQDAVQRTASAAGRYGSGIAQGNVAREVGGVTSAALANQYNQDVSNQFSANSLLDAQRSGNLGIRLNAAAGQTGVDAQNMNNRLSALGGQTAAQGQSYQERLAALAGLSGVQGQNAATRLNALSGQTSAEGQSYSQRLAALAGLTGVQGQNIANQQSAAGDMFNAGQQGQANRFTAAGMLPTLFDSTLDPARAIAGIGAQKEDLATRQMNDKLRIFQEQQNQPRQSIEWLNQLATGQGGLQGGTTTTASAPRTNPFLAGASGALSGYSSGGVGGALLGGAGGLLGSIF